MSESPRIWKRGIAEFVAIFLGVTLSFMADDWRDHLREKDEASRVLAGLAADLENDLNGLREKISLDGSTLEAERWMLENWRRADLPDDSVEAAWREILLVGSYSPIRSEYESASSAGRLQLIANVDLRERIVTHYETDQVHQQVQSGHLLDFVFELWHQSRSRFRFADDFDRPGQWVPEMGEAREAMLPVELIAPWSETRMDAVLHGAVAQAMLHRRMHHYQLRAFALQTESLRADILTELGN